MNRIMKTIHFVLICLCLGNLTWADEESFSRKSDSTGRFLVILRKGNEKDRNAEARVFEEIGDGLRFRKLHHAVLQNPYASLSNAISTDGRFLVTMDDFESHGGGPHALVIYDLVRHEHTVISGEKLLPQEVRLKLNGDKLFHKDVIWTRYYGVFNKSSTVFIPNDAKMCNEFGLPYIVVDLVTRTARIEKTPLADSEDVVQNKFVRLKNGRFFDVNSWTASEECIVIEKSKWPKMMLRTWPSDRASQVYEFDPASEDYVRTTDDKWPSSTTK